MDQKESSQLGELITMNSNKQSQRMSQQACFIDILTKYLFHSRQKTHAHAMINIIIVNIIPNTMHIIAVTLQVFCNFARKWFFALSRRSVCSGKACLPFTPSMNILIGLTMRKKLGF